MDTPMPDAKIVRPEERPELTPDSNLEAAVRGTFPASDPLATTASQGARAVSAEEMMRGDLAQPRTPDDAVTVSQAFPDAETAKIALETLVREGPLDRRCAEIRPGAQAATLEVRAPRADADRIEALLRKAGGRPA
jgi:hypothetical protein